MNNADIGLSSSSWSELENWKKIMDTNFWGCVYHAVDEMGLGRSCTNDEHIVPLMSNTFLRLP
jgi:hypothetical protein